MKALSKSLMVAGALFLFGASLPADAAAWVCGSMDVTFVSENAVRVKNITGNACGSLAPNAQVRLSFPDTDSKERMLALALTALSLEKSVWIKAAGAEDGDLLQVISIAK
ncbi:MAG: hypothetical protein CSA34_02780 [Desulfobulbus propionicus]|nr:MAG: hypothetical protein CSA34_02780 [Desulfobulbus propionicus]